MSGIQSRMVAISVAVALAFVFLTALGGTKMVNGVEVRDWEAIDTNKDGVISPEEMEKFLKDIRAKKTAK